MGNTAKKPIKLYQQSVFIDRDEQRSFFWNKYSSLGKDEYEVISFYGIGGSGKSSLIYKLIDELKGKKKNKDYAYLCLKSNTSKEMIIRALMLALSKNNKKLSFPLVNSALDKIELSGKSVIDAYQNKKGFFDVGDVSDIAGIGAGAISLIPLIGPYAAVNVQGLSFFAKKIVEKKGRKLFKKIEEKTKQYLRDISEKDSKYSIDMLHIFFLEDVWEWFQKRNKPFVIFVDGYDEYVNRGREGIIAEFKDEWINSEDHGLINLPNTIWVFTGRNKLSWWPDSVISDSDSVEISEFSKAYSDEYLSSQGITNNDLLDYLYDLTHGIPLYLELCVNTYKGIKERELREPVCDDFGKDVKQLINRFIVNLYPDAQKVLFMISCLPSVWERELVIDIAEKLGYGNVKEIVSDLVSLSMFDEFPEGYHLHDVVRDVVRSINPNVESTIETLIKYENEKILVSNTIDEMRRHVFSFTESLPLCNASLFSDDDILVILKSLACSFEFTYDYWNYEKCIVPLIEYSERNNLHIKTIVSLRNARNINLQRLGYNSEFLQYSKETYDIANKELDELDEVLLDSLDIVSSAYLFHQLYIEAQSKYTELIEKFTKKYINPNSRIIDCMVNLAMINQGLGHQKQAYNQLNECYNLMKVQYGEDDPRTLKCLNNLGYIMLGLEDYPTALSLLQRCYDLQIAKGGENNSDALYALSNIGECYFANNNIDKALEIWNECYLKRKTLLGERSAWTANSLFNIGKAYFELGEYEKAREPFRVCCEIMEDQFGEESFSTISALMRLAETNSELKKYDDAIKGWKRGYELLKKIDWPDKDRMIDCLYNLSVDYNLSGEIDKSANAMIQCYELTKKYKGETHPDSVSVLKTICAYLLQKKRNDKAVQYLWEYHRIIQTLKGDTAPEAIGVLRNIVNAEIEIENYKSAANTCGDLANCLAKKHGKNSHEVYEVLRAKILCLQEIGDYVQLLDVAQERYNIAKCIQVQSDELAAQIRSIWNFAIYLNKGEELINQKREYYEEMKFKYGLECDDVKMCSSEMLYGYLYLKRYEEALSLEKELLEHYMNSGFEEMIDVTKQMIDYITNKIRERDNRIDDK